ncbi:MAG: bifunctional glutamate N-acetyltransferase/amino-acid acetyltransferase ArgJ [Chloroflexi bacterium]|nr:bifunctional glutamate N-acetyltransferase/amino-acid acetyltransferase ArgJ [Chloroflexota bacterium]
MSVEIERLHDGGITSPAGFSAGALHCGIKSDSSRPDLVMILSDRPSTLAGTFTANRFAAAPVQLDRERVARGSGRGVLINSGTANACTGQPGLENARLMAQLAAERFHVPQEEVLVASTGVNGVQLPIERIRSGVQKLVLSPEYGHIAARGIMTTDTRPKEVAVALSLSDGRTVKIGGICKGAGMIHPNMATMLCFITSDAAVRREFLQSALKAAIANSFNMISVDGDTSTNDTVLVLANGAAGGVALDGSGPDSNLFRQGLTDVCEVLATAIVADGEGAERTMRVEVSGAPTEQDARTVARAIASSSLVKSALHGADPNWGRILCAAGYSGADFDPTAVELAVGSIELVKAGTPLDFDRHAASDAMKESEVQIVLDLHSGEGRAVAWGCELTEAYVVENSAYTT